MFGIRDFVQSHSRGQGDSIKNGKASSIRSKVSKIDNIKEEDDDLDKNLKKVQFLQELMDLSRKKGV